MGTCNIICKIVQWSMRGMAPKITKKQRNHLEDYQGDLASDIKKILCLLHQPNGTYLMSKVPFLVVSVYNRMSFSGQDHNGADLCKELLENQFQVMNENKYSLASVLSIICNGLSTIFFPFFVSRFSIIS